VKKGTRVRALMPITNLEDQRVYLAGESFVMYRPVEQVRELMRKCYIEILDSAASPAVVVSEVNTDGNNG
jgi:hypothetical protein